jgi:lambda family phage portal protein
MNFLSIFRKHKKAVAKRAFSGAKIDRLTSSWATTSQSINKDLQAGGKVLRTRARDLSQNNDYARKYLQMCVSNVVGAKGILLQVKSKTAKGKLDQKSNRRVEQAWAQWSKSMHCAWDGRLSFVEMQRLFIESAARDGEVLVRMVRDESKFGLKLQFLDINRLDENLNKNLGGGAQIRMGIEFDNTGKPVAYHLQTNLENAAAAGARYERINADNIIHAFMGERAEQIRGATWMASAMSRLNMLGAYEEAELVAARIGASKMGFYTSEAGDSFMGEGEDDQGYLIDSAEPGQFAQLPSGTNFTTFDPTHPTSAFESFNKAILRGIASGLGVAYNSLSSDLEGVSFSSIRSGTIEERDQWRVKQNWMIQHFMNRVYDQWLGMQLLNGSIGMGMTDFDKLSEIRWQPKSWQWVDPLKDIKASVEAINAGIKTASEVVAEQGGDIEDVYEQLAYEQQLAKEKGLNLSINNEVTANETNQNG